MSKAIHNNTSGFSQTLYILNLPSKNVNAFQNYRPINLWKNITEVKFLSYSAQADNEVF